MRTLPLCTLALLLAFLGAGQTHAQRYTAPDGRLRVALSQQPFLPNGTSPGPKTMATGGIQRFLADQGAHVRLDEAALTVEEDREYGGWKRLGYALGHFAELVERNERDGYFTHRARSSRGCSKRSSVGTRRHRRSVLRPSPRLTRAVSRSPPSIG